MTLILALANQQQVVLISDRRLSCNGQIVDDESNKAAILNCRDARVAVAFTGLARAGQFHTRRWLLETLLESTQPDRLLTPTVLRFCDNATRDFAKLGVDNKKDKCLSVILAGYCYDETPPRCYYYLVSNFEKFNPPTTLPVPSDEFSCDWGRELRPPEEPVCMVLAAGEHRALTQAHMRSLRTLLQSNKPAKAILGKGVEVLGAVAEASISAERVGKDCTSILLPSHPDSTALVHYHSSKTSKTLHGVSLIEARGDRFSYIIDSPEMRMESSTGRDVILGVPKVGRNQPCPCVSGKKYKKCHGRSRREKTWFQFGSDK